MTNEERGIKALEYSKQWRKENPDKFRESQKRYREKRKEMGYKRPSFYCFLCDKSFTNKTLHDRTKKHSDIVDKLRNVEEQKKLKEQVEILSAALKSLA